MSDHVTADMDGGWKQLIEDYVEEFFRFFFPQVHAGIDFSAGYQFPDKMIKLIRFNVEGRQETQNAGSTFSKDEDLRRLSLLLNGWSGCGTISGDLTKYGPIPKHRFRRRSRDHSV